MPARREEERGEAKSIENNVDAYENKNRHLPNRKFPPEAGAHFLVQVSDQRQDEQEDGRGNDVHTPFKFPSFLPSY